MFKHLYFYIFLLAVIFVYSALNYYFIYKFNKAYTKNTNYIYILVGLCILIIIYALFEAGNIQINNVEIQSSKIKNKILIAQISDVHFSAIIGVSTANKIKWHWYLGTTFKVSGKSRNCCYYFKA